jgi:hypothetical protein
VHGVSRPVTEASAKRNDMSRLTESVFNAILFKVGQAADHCFRHRFGDAAPVIRMYSRDIPVDWQTMQGFVTIKTEKPCQGGIGIENVSFQAPCPYAGFINYVSRIHVVPRLSNGHLQEEV